MKPWFFAALAVFISMPLAASEVAQVAIGQARLSLPSPEGFHRGDGDGDGESAAGEKYQKLTVTPGNRLLAHYVADEDLDEPSLTPIFHAQTPRGIAEVIYSTTQFGEMARMLVAITAMPKASDHAEAPATGPQSETQQSETSFEVGETKSLGVYDSGVHHVNFAILGRVGDGVDESGFDGLSYTAVAMTNVAGKVINLYCTVAAEPEDNQIWARQQLAKWQENVLASNPAAIEEIKSASPTRLVAIIGAIAAAVGALVITIVKRGKCPPSGGQANGQPRV